MGDYRAFWRSFVSNEHLKKRPHHALNRVPSSQPGASGPRVLLEWLGLGRYADAFEEEGYLDVTLIREASPPQRREMLVDELNMKAADAKALETALETLLPDLTDPLER